MNNDPKLMAERCRQELMRLYRDCRQQEEPAAEVTEHISETIDERFPEPDISELDEPVCEPVDEMPEETSHGYIQVNVRTGGDAFPVEDASVTVTETGDGRRLLIAAAVTDMSGATARIEVPAPDAVWSQAPDPAVRPYSLFDVTVTAEGFFDARSVDIPVFAGITSVQDINMTPVPLYGKSSGETLTVYNQEPDL